MFATNSCQQYPLMYQQVLIKFGDLLHRVLSTLLIIQLLLAVTERLFRYFGMHFGGHCHYGEVAITEKLKLD